MWIYSDVFLPIQPESRIAEAMIPSYLKLCIIKLAQHFDTSPLGKTHELQRMLLTALWAVIFPLRKMLDKLLIILWRYEEGSLFKNTGDSGPGFWQITNLFVYIKIWVVGCEVFLITFLRVSIYKCTPKSLQYTPAI